MAIADSDPEVKFVCWPYMAKAVCFTTSVKIGEVPFCEWGKNNKNANALIFEKI